ncbi:MAG: hypothetical protein M5R36_24940 [Deltaproteobacteria bacterium]|nr:hypothetical protein [Deltaproteobacteria bacterium]
MTGSWLPSTAGAKATFFVAESATLLSSAGAATFAVFKLVLRLGLFVPFFLLGAWHLLRKGPGRFEIPLFSLLFYAAYIARFGMALNMYWLRYQMPIVLLYVIVSGVGLGAFARWTRERRAELALRFVAAFVMLAGASMDFAERIVDFRKDIVSTERGAHATALWLRDNTPENALIAAHDIGAPLYFSNRRVLDLVGLTDPDVARVNREDRTKAALWTHLAERRPDYLVMFKLWDEQFFHFSGRDTHGVLEPVWQSKPSRVRPGAQYVVYRCSWN